VGQLTRLPLWLRACLQYSWKPWGTNVCEGNFSIWKSRVQFFFHNTQTCSQSLHFPLLSRLAFCLSKMALKRVANCTSPAAHVNVCAAEENLEEELQYIIKAVFDYRFNSNTHTHMFLFVTQAFWVVSVQIRFYWCATYVHLKLLNGRPACDCWAQTSWQVMQQDSDTAHSGKPSIVLYCVKRSMNKPVAVLPHFWKIHC